MSSILIASSARHATHPRPERLWSGTFQSALVPVLVQLWLLLLRGGGQRLPMVAERQQQFRRTGLVMVKHTCRSISLATPDDST